MTTHESTPIPTTTHRVEVLSLAGRIAASMAYDGEWVTDAVAESSVALAEALVARVDRGTGDHPVPAPSAAAPPEEGDSVITPPGCERMSDEEFGALLHREMGGVSITAAEKRAVFDEARRARATEDEAKRLLGFHSANIFEAKSLLGDGGDNTLLGRAKHVLADRDRLAARVRGLESTDA